MNFFEQLGVIFFLVAVVAIIAVAILVALYKRERNRTDYLSRKYIQLDGKYQSALREVELSNNEATNLRNRYEPQARKVNPQQVITSTASSAPKVAVNSKKASSLFVDTTASTNFTPVSVDSSSSVDCGSSSVDCSF